MGLLKEIPRMNTHESYQRLPPHGGKILKNKKKSHPQNLQKGIVGSMQRENEYPEPTDPREGGGEGTASLKVSCA